MYRKKWIHKINREIARERRDRKNERARASERAICVWAT